MYTVGRMFGVIQRQQIYLKILYHKLKFGGNQCYFDVENSQMDYQHVVHTCTICSTILCAFVNRQFVCWNLRLFLQTIACFGSYFIIRQKQQLVGQKNFQYIQQYNQIFEKERLSFEKV
eukprot:TRINITY_DN3142_c5_g4_i2.p5 TRINITY_DN3142_c5_g4~~TRINITY_DN3142_c5_g4_i2.p5  ORF type:complete len:119 (+),score=4.39 TRINITY_DN3142_c5_g4_i2:566-922(+)